MQHATFAVHRAMRSHTGGTLSLDKGALYSTLVRQKLNTKSSTEAELVGVDDRMPMILGTRQFRKGQGDTITYNVVDQSSSNKWTRRLVIRYFFVTDRIQAGHITVEYCCPTYRRHVG